MILGTLSKQPNDRADFDIDCTQWLSAYGDTINYVAAEVDDTDLDILSVSHLSGFVKVWLDGGVDGTQYKVTVTMNSTGGRQVEMEVRVRVRAV